MNPRQNVFSSLQIKNKISALHRTFAETQKRNHYYEHSSALSKSLRCDDIHSYSIGLEENQEISDLGKNKLRDKIVVLFEFYTLLRLKYEVAMLNLKIHSTATYVR